MTATDSENIARTYTTERRKLLGYIRTRIKDRVEAEDILQDVFYQLTVGFNDLRRIENITAWLYRVAENRIIDRFRKRKVSKADYRENTSEDEQGPLTLEEILPSEAMNPEDDELNDLILSFWQAAGLFLLSKILLTGVAPGSHRSGPKKDWRKNFREKYHRQVDITEPAGEKV